MVKTEEHDEKNNLNLPFRIIDMYASLFKSILYLNVIGEFLDYLRIRNIYNYSSKKIHGFWIAWKVGGGGGIDEDGV